MFNHFQIVDLTGNAVCKIQTPLPIGAVVTADDLAEWQKKKKRSIIKYDGNEAYAKHFNYIERYKTSIYKRKPIFSDIAVTPEGNLLVEGEIDSDTRKREYWLTDPSGKLLKQFNTTGVTAITISTNYILVIKETENDENRVYCITRKGKDVEDLNPKLFE